LPIAAQRFRDLLPQCLDFFIHPVACAVLDDVPEPLAGVEFRTVRLQDSQSPLAPVAAGRRRADGTPLGRG
jgi:hypothetical protein